MVLYNAERGTSNSVDALSDRLPSVVNQIEMLFTTR
jgi:hypothetical protein